MHRTTKVAIAMLFGTLAAGCGQGSLVPRDFTDRQIFEGAIFGVGPVAELLPEARTQLRPELYARSAEELSAMAEARAATIDALERNQPGLLYDFAEAARSGDPVRVQAMLARAIEGISGTAAGFASARTPNLPIDRRTPNLPVESARTPNLPIDRRTPNLPVESARMPNLPIDRRTPNLPVESARTPNLPIDRRTPNLPIESARTPNLPIDRRTPNLPVGSASLRPAWELLSSRLFAEQLSSSLAMTFGPRTIEH